MTTTTASPPESPEQRDLAARYEDYRPKVRSVLAKQAPWLDSDAREEVYQQGWLAVLEAENAGRHVENELSYLFRTTLNIALDAITSADARRRTTFDPISSRFRQIPDPGPGPLEIATVHDEANIGRTLLDRLGPRQRAVAIRRYGHGYTPDEICGELGLSRRRYEKTIDKITVSLGGLVADYTSGRFTSSDRKLLARCILGEADAQEREMAERLVDTAHGRALLCHVRHVFRDAAMTAPFPVVPSAGVPDQLGSFVEHAKSAVTGLIGRSSASASEAVTNLSMTGAGRGSGAFAASVVACVICGAGGVAAVTGTTPSDVKDAIVRQDDPDRQTTETTPAEPPRTETVAVPPPVSTETTPEPAPQVVETTPEPAPTQEEQRAAPPAPRQEFGWEQKQTPASPSPSPSPSTSAGLSSGEFSAPAPPSGNAGGAGGSEFGFESP